MRPVSKPRCVCTGRRVAGHSFKLTDHSSQECAGDDYHLSKGSDCADDDTLLCKVGSAGARRRGFSAVSFFEPPALGPAPRLDMPRWDSPANMTAGAWYTCFSVSGSFDLAKVKIWPCRQERSRLALMTPRTPNKLRTAGIEKAAGKDPWVSVNS